MNIRHFFYLSVFFLFSCNNGSDTPLEVLDSNLWISNDSSTGFQTLDDLRDIGVINGNLTILSNSFVNLDFLENLKTINGELLIENNPQLESLDGLDNLESVGSLKLRHNEALRNVNAITQIEIFNTFQIINIGATTMQPFKNFTQSWKSILISENPNLTDLAFLADLKEIKGNLSILANPKLENLVGLSKLESIDGFFEIKDNEGLINFEGLSNLKTVGHNFWIHNNANLLSFAGLDRFESAERTLYISFCDKLQDLTGLENIKKVGQTLKLQKNKNLKNLAGIEAPEIVRIEIFNNDQLTDLQGLENLVLSMSMRILQNPLLNDFCAAKNAIQLNPLMGWTVNSNGINPTAQEVVNDCE